MYTLYLQSLLHLGITISARQDSAFHSFITRLLSFEIGVAANHHFSNKTLTTASI